MTNQNDANDDDALLDLFYKVDDIYIRDLYSLYFYDNCFYVK